MSGENPSSTTSRSNGGGGGGGGGGFVKSLLFPKYADAGANDAFQHQQQGSEYDYYDEGENGSSSKAESSNRMLEELTTQSDATTTIHDNRTRSKVPQKHEMQYDGSRVGGYAPTTALVSAVLSTAAAASTQQHQEQKEMQSSIATRVHDSLLVETGQRGIIEEGDEENEENEESSSPSKTQQQQQQQDEDTAKKTSPQTSSSNTGGGASNKTRTSSFFPSTNPTTEPAPSTTTTPEGPSSPPKLMRPRMPPSRSLSTTTEIGNGNNTPHESNSTSVLGDPLTSLQEEVGMPTTTTGTSPITKPPPPPPPPVTANSSSDQLDISFSSDKASTVTSGVASSVLGYHFLDRSQINEEEDDDNKNDNNNENYLETPRKDNRSGQQHERQDLNTTNDESLPPITEAALKERDELQKQQQQLLNDNNGTDGIMSDIGLCSDVNSNLSEFGTVIDAGTNRLEEVEAMAALVEGQHSFESSHDGDQQEENEQQHHNIVMAPFTPREDEHDDTSNDFGNSSPLHKPDKGNQVMEALSLPTLDSQRQQHRRLQRQEEESSSGSKKKIQQEHMEITSSNTDHHQQQLGKTRSMDDGGAGGDGERPSASSMVSAAFRRLGNAVPEILSAPATPRTPMTAPQTPRTVGYNHHQRSLSSSGRRDQNGRNDSLSSSLLLRSPGSAAHFSVSRNKSTSLPPSSKATTTPRGGAAGSTDQPNTSSSFLLSPRLSNSASAFFQRASSTPRRQSPSGNGSGGRSTNSPQLRQANSLPSPIRFATRCLSTEDTTTDEENDPIYYLDGRDDMPPRTRTPPPPRTSSYESLFPSDGATGYIRPSRSWDVGSSVSSTQGGEEDFRKVASSAFRLTPSDDSSSRNHHHYGSRVLHHRQPRHNDPTNNSEEVPPRRIRSSDSEHAWGSTPTVMRSKSNPGPSSPSQQQQQRAVAIALRTPQRVEMERDDALDILACLVERSLDFDQEKDKKLSSIIESTASLDSENDTTTGYSTDGSLPESVDTRDDDKVSTMADAGGADSKLKMAAKERLRKLRKDSVTVNDMEVINDLRRLSQLYEKKQLKKKSNSSGDSDDDNTTNDKPGFVVNHESRMEVLDELLRSHQYAVEMKRAAKSASAWLHSVDPVDSKEDDGNTYDRKTLKSQSGNSALEEQEQNKGSRVSTEGVQPEIDENVGQVALQAMLHAARRKITEMQRKNAEQSIELQSCRAEIGRLSRERKTEVLFSPNRSIFDNDDETTTSEEVSKADATVETIEGIADDASPILEASGIASETDYNGLEPSFCLSETEGHELAKWEGFAEVKKEVVMLKASLASANEVIERLYAESTRERNEGKEEKVEGSPPIIKIENPELSKELDDYKESLKQTINEVNSTRQLDTSHMSEKTAKTSPSSRTINVRMLDGENFVTGWDDLAPPLPPPPDHDLRSPIVRSLLESWTSDQAMHDSLLSWMDKVLSGADPESVAPLTISSLNHQIRDGFAMHVFPQLLRRPDVLVEVKTRAHRTTSYDMAVTITPSNNALSLTADDQSTTSSSHHSNTFGSQRTSAKHLLAFKANHSDRMSEVGTSSVAHSAVTEHMANYARNATAKEYDSDSTGTGTAGTKGFYSSSMLADEGSVASSVSRGSSTHRGAIPQQAGLMTTLGGAFGGLLSRRKVESPILRSAMSGEESLGGLRLPSNISTGSSDDVPPFLRPPPPPPSPAGHQAQTAASHHAADDGDEEQPYHRVVSAPPGRIGATIVQYRGHAVVSDVAKDSPLSGWVFPSDVLIAIDEVPVSGMRVRDIIQILNQRKDRQRALRVISSQSMNEFTLNTTTTSEAGTPSL